MDKFYYENRICYEDNFSYSLIKTVKIPTDFVFSKNMKLSENTFGFFVAEVLVLIIVLSNKSIIVNCCYYAIFGCFYVLKM